PTVAASGDFTTEPAPAIPLSLEVTHQEGKYRPRVQTILPPFDLKIDVSLERNPDFKPLGVAIFKIANPPASRKLNHKVVVYSESADQIIGFPMNTSEVGPNEKEMPPGIYQV